MSKNQSIIPSNNSEKPVKKKKKEDVFYVNAAEFRSDIVKYYESGLIPNSLGEKIQKIAQGLGFATNFINYPYREEMIGDAVVKMMTALQDKKFDVFRNEGNTNPFSYFTAIAWHAFINRIKKEKRNNETIERYKEHIYEELLNNGMEGIKIKVNPNSDDIDYSESNES